MQIELSVRVRLDEAEQFKATERYLASDRPELTILAQRIVKSGLGSEVFHCHGPKVLKSGKVSETKQGYVPLRAGALPIPLLEKIQASLAPHLAAQKQVGSEAARQAALG